MRFCHWVVGAAAALSMSLLLGSPEVRAGSVEIDPASVTNVDVSASLTPISGAGSAQTNSDTGGLSKPNISVSATAHLDASDSEPARDAIGTAHASLIHSADQFQITGGTSAEIEPASAFVTAAHVQSVTSIDFPFSLAGAGALNYSFDIHTLVLKNEKITLLLDRSGAASSSLFSQVFDESGKGSVDDLSAGKYRLRVIAGSEATNLGVQGEHGSTDFTVAVSSSGQGNGIDDGGGAVIPLPPGAQTGAMALGTVFVGLALRRRRAVA
jgi:hypothetical protein